MSQVTWQDTLDAHRRWLRTVVFARVGEVGAVEDIMQEIALIVLRQRGAASAIQNPAAWLYRLAVRQSLLYRRKHGRRRRLMARFAERSACDDDQRSADPLEWLLADERRVLVRNAVEQLAPRDKEILLLKYTEDWSYAQLAQHLGVSHSAIESRLHRARERLRQILTACQPAETYG